MSSIKVEFPGEGAQKVVRAFLFVHPRQRLDLRPRNLAQRLCVDSHASGEQCEALPLELSQSDEVHQRAQGFGDPCSLRAELLPLDQFKEPFSMQGKRLEREAAEHGMFELR